MPPSAPAQPAPRKPESRQLRNSSWSPYQLQHLRGAELRAQFSLEHVRAALGHSHTSMSAHYAAGADLKRDEELVGKCG